MKASIERLFITSLSMTVILSTAVAFVNATAFSKSAPQKSDSRSNLKQLGQALRMYIQDYDVFPPMKDFATIRPLLAPYLENESAFINPDTKQPFLPNPSLSRRDLDTVCKESYQKKQGVAAFYEATARTNGSRYVLVVPKPDGLNKKGEPFWKEGSDFIEVGPNDVVPVGSSDVVPGFKVENMSKAGWAKVKKASNIR